MLRRSFLGSLLGAPLALRAQAGRRVLIAGAGLAGLSAAWELARAGFDPLIIEASARAGGRVRTLREPFAQGLYAEAGAVRVASHHETVHHFIREFGLETEPFLPSGLGTVYLLDGHRIVERPGERPRWPLDLPPTEQNQTLDEIYEHKIHPFLAKFATADRNGPWPPPALRELDALTQPEFWARLGLSPGARRLLALGYRLDRASALWGLLEELDLLPSTGFVRILGGNDRLPAAFAQRLDGRILYGTPLRAVRQDASGVEITVERHGALETLRGAALLCTLPLPLLREVDFTPALAPERRDLIAQIPYMPVSRMYLQTRRRFWLDQNLSGAAIMDRPSQRFWPAAGVNPTQRGILHSYTWDREAHELDALPHDERVRRTLADAEAAFPGIRPHVEASAHWSWQHQPWQRGAFAQFLPGQVTRLHELLPQPEGRVFFAGAHLWSSVSWMEGALVSSKRAVRAMLAAVRD